MAASLSEVVLAFQSLSDEYEQHLHRETGVIVGLTKSDIRPYLDGVRDVAQAPEWIREPLETIEEARSSNDWVELPDPSYVSDRAIMRNFCECLPDDEVCRDLMDALYGSGASKMFKEKVKKHGMRDDWQSFRRESVAEVAEEWLQEHDIPYDDDTDEADPRDEMSDPDLKISDFLG